MSMLHSVNQNKVAAQLSACGRDVMMGLLAGERTRELSSLPVSRVRELVATREAVILPYSKRNRSYHLILDKAAQCFIVAVVAIDQRERAASSARLVTILSREQFESDAGAISIRFLRTAAGRSLDPVEFREWESREIPNASLRRSAYRVIAYYTGSDGRDEYKVFRNPPVCRQYVDEHSLSAAAGHPGFWSWFSRRAAAENLPVEAVKSLQIADTDKLTLDVRAPARSCPCCATHPSH